MNYILLRDFIKVINELDDEKFLLYTISYNIAPTLKRIKPATLINFSRAGRNLYGIWENKGELICRYLNINVFEMKKNDNNVFLLFYDYNLLRSILQDKRVGLLLLNFNYEIEGDIEVNLRILKNRFKHSMPHEIGIFLGIPLGDVVGYIKNFGEDYKMVNYWKVYENVKEAQAIFRLYEKSKEEIINEILNEK